MIDPSAVGGPEITVSRPASPGKPPGTSRSTGPDHPALRLGKRFVIQIVGTGPQLASRGVKDPPVRALVAGIGAGADDDRLGVRAANPAVDRPAAHVARADQLAPGPVSRTRHDLRELRVV